MSYDTEHPPADATHVPCCSAHGIPMTCERYRRTHFVEVRPCCSIDRARLDSEPHVFRPRGLTHD